MEKTTDVVTINQLLGRIERVEQMVDPLPSKLDLKTRICLMSAIVFGVSYGGPDLSVDQAVKVATQLEDSSEEAVKKMKEERPIGIQRNYGGRRYKQQESVR